jgi:SAM-dependent methyltransferase
VSIPRDPTAFLCGLQAIAARKARPQPFVDVGSLPWHEADFSRHFLRTATRSSRYTQREIAFLERNSLLTPGHRILDLACGGGRHSIAMAKRGAVVTGIDLGPAAIDAARRRTKRAGVHVEWLHGDLRHLPFENVFHLVTFIFGCFTEMPRRDAEAVLKGISRSLRPGGTLLLDVYAPAFFAALDGMQEWWVGGDFIAGRFPQLVLSEYFYYTRTKTYARRDFICEAETGVAHAFGLSGQAYSLAELKHMLAAAGLTLTAACGDWKGTPVRRDSRLFVLLASKDS